MRENFIERPYKNEKEGAIAYVQELLKQAREDRRSEDVDKLGNLVRLLNTKKYGLVWEEHAEWVEEEMKTKIPVFVEDETKKIVGNPDSENYNFLLEGDNLHCLHLLQKTHRGKIDIIYIDPPYNTENSLTYNDTRIGESDSYRHSKWLSFMDRRLRHAQELLSEQGIIFISIDDNEGYNLKVLADEIFNESNFMGSFSVTKAEGGGQAKHIVKGHDFVLIYAKNLETAKPLGKSKDVRGKTFEKDGEIYWIQEDAYRKIFGQYGNLHYEEILDYRDQKFKDDIDRKINNGEIILLDKGEEGHVLGKVRKLSNDYSKYHSVLKQLNADGKTELLAFGLDAEFDYPKPVNLIKELISGAAFLRAGKLTVLDFFAGSGTTGQAVMEFIKETSRADINFILCTNNEISSKQKLKFVQSLGYLKDYKISANTSDSAIDKKINNELSKHHLTLDDLAQTYQEEYNTYGICQSVTYPRLKKINSGFKWARKGKKILYKKKLTEKNLTLVDKFLSDIEKIKEKEGYEEYKVKMDDTGCLILEADIKEDEVYNPIPFNLKYFRTHFVVKEEFPDVTLEYELLNYVTPLVELEFGVDISNPKVQVILSEEQLDNMNESDFMENSSLFFHPEIFFDAEQERILRDKNITKQEIPNYYFGKDMWS